MLDWTGENQLRVDGTTFETGMWNQGDADDAAMRLLKPRAMIEAYDDLRAELENPRVVELGIHRGGSTAFLALLLAPSAMLAIDISTEEQRPLTDFISERDLGDSVHTRYGVDQADQAALVEELEATLGEAPLDLVIDDASHLLGPTLASFEVLFPRIRPGGLFVFEDWSSELTFERVAVFLGSEDDGEADMTTSLTRMMLELVLVVGTDPGIISEIRIQNGLAFVRRGDDELDPETFSLAACYGTSGSRLLGT